MFGYVITQKEELKLREFSVYNGYYCGLCKTIGAEYGQLLRMGLQYEMAFLALFLESLDGSPDQITEEHCVAHHIRKKPVIRCSASEYAAAMTVILGYENNMDDLRDEGKNIKTVSRSLALRRAYDRASSYCPDAAAQVHSRLSALYQLEEQKCTSLDDPANTFGEVMRTVFLSYFTEDENRRVLRVCGEFAYQLGRWIYLIDALDDLTEDKKTGNYNPFAYIQADRVYSLARSLLYHALGEMSRALDLLDIRKNRGIIENIVYLGLRSKTDQILEKGEEKDGKH